MQKKFIIFCCLQKRCDNPSLDTQNRISESPSFSRLLSHENAPSHTFCCPSSHTSHKHLYLILPS